MNSMAYKLACRILAKIFVFWSKNFHSLLNGSSIWYCYVMEEEVCYQYTDYSKKIARFQIDWRSNNYFESPVSMWVTPITQNWPFRFVYEVGSGRRRKDSGRLWPDQTQAREIFREGVVGVEGKEDGRGGEDRRKPDFCRVSRILAYMLRRRGCSSRELRKG